MFGPKKEEESERLEKLHNDEFRNLYSSSNLSVWSSCSEVIFVLGNYAKFIVFKFYTGRF
jgi:hypothetical protein